jgi:tetratricopeptide (TPR) repeat protein
VSRSFPILFQDFVFEGSALSKRNRRPDRNPVGTILDLDDTRSWQSNGASSEGIDHAPAQRFSRDHVNGHYYLGLALTAAGDLEGAATQYRTTLRLKPNHVNGHYYLGLALKALGRKAEAREEFMKALRLLPDTPGNQGMIKKVRQRILELE